MKKEHIVRLIAFVALSFALLFTVKYFFAEEFTYAHVSGMIQNSGPIGIALFLLLAIVGSFLHVPAYVFLAVCFLFFDGFTGLLLGIATASVIFISHFLFARTIGGKSLGQLKHPFIAKTLSRLDQRPIQSIIMLRLMFFMSPFITFMLGVTSVKFKHFLAGSLMGISLHFAGIFLLVHFSRETVVEYLTKLL